MKKVLLGLLLMFLSIGAFSQIIVSGNITSNTTWTNNNIYILQGFVKVTAGATLTIEPGTIIKGDFVSKGALIIERDAMIMAQGTPEQPIVFTSQKPAGERAYGDWGGLIICGRGAVNQPANAQNGTVAGEAVVEGGVGSIYGGGANPEEDDNSGVVSYVRIEFGGIPFQPNSEINGLTMCAVGAGTQIDHVQISYCGDDAFEWFGGSVNVKNIIAYRNWDDDFDTDFGYHGNVQFGLVIRDPQIADQSGSNGFESDNDAQGTTATPNTQAKFSNVTVVGPYAFSSTLNSNYKRALHLRRNTQTSAFNSVFIGYPTGLLIESTSTQGNATNDLLRFKNSVITQMNDSLACTTSADPNNTNGSFNITTWFNNAAFSNTLVNNVSDLMFNHVDLNDPDFSLAAGSPLNTGASFSDGYLQNPFFEAVSFRGAMGSEDWTSCWTEWDPQNEPYNAAIDNSFSAMVDVNGSLSFCQGGSVELQATTDADAATYVWSNGETGENMTISTSGNYSFVATNSNGCSVASEAVTVSVNDNPTASISADGSTSFCTGGSVTLTATSGSSYLWSNGASSSSIVVDETGEFSVEVTDANGCTGSSNSISVSVSDSPVPTISTNGSASICEGSNVILTSSPAETYEWSLNGKVISGANGQTYAATEEGLYTVTVTNTDACDGVGTSTVVLVNVNPTPVAEFTADFDFGSYTVQFLNGSTNATSYLWNFGDGNTSTSANPTHTYVDGGDYTVTLTATNGDCSDVFTFELNSVSVAETSAVATMSVYPNPSNGMVNIQLGEASNEVVISIYDIAGKWVVAERVLGQVGQQIITLNVDQLENGMYVMQVQNGNAIANVSRLVIKK